MRSRAASTLSPLVQHSKSACSNFPSEFAVPPPRQEVPRNQEVMCTARGRLRPRRGDYFTPRQSTRMNAAQSRRSERLLATAQSACKSCDTRDGRDLATETL